MPKRERESARSVPRREVDPVIEEEDHDETEKCSREQNLRERSSSFIPAGWDMQRERIYIATRGGAILTAATANLVCVPAIDGAAPNDLALKDRGKSHRATADGRIRRSACLSGKRSTLAPRRVVIGAFTCET